MCACMQVKGLQPLASGHAVHLYMQHAQLMQRARASVLPQRDAFTCMMVCYASWFVTAGIEWHMHCQLMHNASETWRGQRVAEIGRGWLTHSMQALHSVGACHRRVPAGPCSVEQLTCCKRCDLDSYNILAQSTGAVRPECH